MKKAYLAMLIAGVMVSENSNAVEVNFSGYGSIRAGTLVNDDITPARYGYEDEIEFKNESLFALQTNATVNDKWNATLVLQARGNEDFDVEARWAYLSYQYSAETSFSFGRFALPYFWNSDTQDIGYSHNYSRLPKSIYLGEEYDVIEGVRVIHATYIGDGDLTLKGSFGSFSGEVSEIDFELDTIIQASAQYTYDEWFSVFAGVLSADATFKNQERLDGLIAGSLPGYTITNGVLSNPANASVYNMEDFYAVEDSTLYWTVGFSVEQGQWLLGAEYVSYEIDDSFSEETQAFYVSLGYRISERLVATAVYHELDQSFDYEQAKSSDPLVNAVIRGVTDGIYSDDAFDTKGIHFRYDADQGIAYKFEFSQITNELADDSANLVTLGIDFVF